MNIYKSPVFAIHSLDSAITVISILKYMLAITNSAVLVFMSSIPTFVAMFAYLEMMEAVVVVLLWLAGMMITAAA